MTTSLIPKRLKYSMRQHLRVLRGTLSEKNPTPDLQHFLENLPTTAANANNIAGY